MATEHPHQPKCETCRYWHQYDKRRNFGECFRYPPRSKWTDHGGNEIDHGRPKTCKWDWCGEHAETSHAPETAAGEHENPQQGKIQSRARLKVGADGQHSEQKDAIHDALSQMVGWAEDGSPDDGRQIVLTEARAALKGISLV